MMWKLSRDIAVFLVLLLLVGSLVYFNIEKEKPFGIEKPDNIIFDKKTNTLNLDSLTLKQKIAQMTITFERENNKEVLQNMLIGGIHFGARENKDEFSQLINGFQENAIIPFFITADLEGCWNPFENFKEFPTLREIKSAEEAYETGRNHGKLLSELGFNVNFAPVLDLEDTIWECRNFDGSPEEIAEKANAYISGLEKEGIMATSKHYPGKTIRAKDPHKELNFAVIADEDLLPFKNTMENVPALMVSHIIVGGSLDSEDKPAVVSEKLISNLRNQFTGLIVTDEIRMEGLRSYYSDIEDMYIDLFKADNDVVLYFETDPEILYRMIEVVEEAVLNGEISEERIDKSVIKILEAKGIKVE